ncbi:MAG: substrate-binding domain-containing protein [Rhodocyclaceae bacterium]
MHTSPIRVELGCDWTLTNSAGRRCDAGLFRVLEAIREAGSLVGAAREMGLSYRHLWGRLHEYSELFGTPLASLEKGRGARLTALGGELLRMHDEVSARLAPRLDAAARLATGRLSAPRPDAPPSIRIAASHDGLLARLREIAEQTQRLSVELRFCGSLEALAALGRGECELAGFHFASSPIAAEARARFRGLLRAGSHRLVELMTRSQGLIVARGNPKRIRTAGDLARPGIVFVNRQPGSGTRILFDALLAASGVEAESIAGYGHEEFTHDAVAATVAAGLADAGFGIRAATAPLDLDFVPVEKERYFLAGRTATFTGTACRELLRLAGSSAMRRIAASLPGYVLRRRFSTATVRDALGGSP